jgi:hypothetical protein
MKQVEGADHKLHRQWSPHALPDRIGNSIG